MTQSAAQAAPNARDDSFDHLVYLRVFEGCNLHCEHCFIPANPKTMKLSDFDCIGERLRTFATPGQRILFQWHGGEPTALGAHYLSEALERLHRGATEFSLSHGIQTNLMTYDEGWARVFAQYFDSSIGVSWDPEIRLLRRGRPETNAEYEAGFWANLQRLVRDGIEPYLVVTGTRVFFQKFRDPFEFFSMMEERGIRRAHIERLTPTGYARESWGRIGLTNAENSRHMARFARAYRAYTQRDRAGKQPFSLSPFDGLIESVARLRAGEAGGYGCLSGDCDSRFHTIDANGYKFGCTALNSEYDNARFSGTPIQIVDLTDARERRQLDCRTCRYKPICSSGCMATPRQDQSGECAGGSQVFSAIEQMLDG